MSNQIRLSIEDSVRFIKQQVTTLKLGNFETVEELRQALLESGCTLNREINEVIDKLAADSDFTLTSGTDKLDIHMSTSAQLGYSGKCPLFELFAAIRDIGGVGLSVEAGLQHVLQSPRQFMGYEQLIYQLPIPQFVDGYPTVFRVEDHYGERYLNCYLVGAEYVCRGDEVLVFGFRPNEGC